MEYRSSNISRWSIGVLISVGRDGVLVSVGEIGVQVSVGGVGGVELDGMVSISTRQ